MGISLIRYSKDMRGLFIALLFLIVYSAVLSPVHAQYTGGDACVNFHNCSTQVNSCTNSCGTGTSDFVTTCDEGSCTYCATDTSCTSLPPSTICQNAQVCQWEQSGDCGDGTCGCGQVRTLTQVCTYTPPGGVSQTAHCNDACSADSFCCVGCSGSCG